MNKYSDLISQLDNKYPSYRDHFVVPTIGSMGIEGTLNQDSECTYLCGNSLGLMPKAVKGAINAELDAWGARAVESHFRHPGVTDGLTSWVDIDLPLLPLLAPIVGAKENEVAVMGSLTANLNSLLISFYKPKGKRTKVLFERKAFPSDYYAILNLVKLFGYDETHLLQVDLKEGETYLRTEDIIRTMKENADEIALVCFSGVHYYSGQYFDMETITKEAKSLDLTIGWDLAHAIGNIPLELHKWNVDFATWCSYKYLNSGPGAISGIFVHEKHTENISSDNFPARPAGWWGNNAEERFHMYEKFNPIKSALSYRQSNPSVIDVVSLKKSLEIFEKAGGISKLRKKSIELTGFLQKLLEASKYYLDQNEQDPKKLGFKILTPLNEESRGCQLSLYFQPHKEEERENTMNLVYNFLHENGIIVDDRKPDSIRIAPAPLYNTFEDVYTAAINVETALDTIAQK